MNVVVVVNNIFIVLFITIFNYLLSVVYITTYIINITFIIIVAFVVVIVVGAIVAVFFISVGRQTHAMDLRMTGKYCQSNLLNNLLPVAWVSHSTHSHKNSDCNTEMKS